MRERVIITENVKRILPIIKVEIVTKLKDLEDFNFDC